MEFSLTSEQRLLQDSVARYLAGDCPLDKVREAADSERTLVPDVWQGLAELGIQGAIIPENYGGVGLTMLDAALIAEALGGAVTPVPFIANAIMAPVALLAAGSEEQKETWLPRIAAGDAIVGVGVAEAIGRRETDGVVAVDGTLNGKSMFVLDGVDADAFLLVDVTGALHLVDSSAPGVSRRKLKSIDRTRSMAEVVLKDAAGERLPGSADSLEPLRQTIDAGRLMLAADTLGAAQTMLDKSIAYAGERKQFNRVIGSFQAVKHLCAEMAAEIEPCRALVWYAGHAADAIPDEARAMACHAKAHLAEVGQFVARTATEVHGGMGFTDLLGLHYWFKRIGLNRQCLGAPELVREEAARAQGWIAA